jgi:hypothetical protein
MQDDVPFPKMLGPSISFRIHTLPCTSMKVSMKFRLSLITTQDLFVVIVEGSHMSLV